MHGGREREKEKKSTLETHCNRQKDTGVGGKEHKLPFLKLLTGNAFLIYRNMSTNYAGQLKFYIGHFCFIVLIQNNSR